MTTPYTTTTIAEMLAEIEVRASLASDGPWHWRQDYEMPDGSMHWELSNAEGSKQRKTIDGSLVLQLDRPEWLHRPAQEQPNWVFIANARKDIPDLIAIARQLLVERNRLQEENKRLIAGPDLTFRRKGTARRQLLDNAKESMLARIAKYNDPNNDEYDWDDVRDKWERHALAAVQDLAAVEAERDTARTELEAAQVRVEELEKAEADRVQGWKEFKWPKQKPIEEWINGAVADFRRRVLQMVRKKAKEAEIWIPGNTSAAALLRELKKEIGELK